MKKELEVWYVILNMNCKYEICRRCPKSGLFKGSYEDCEKWIKQKQKEEKKDEMKNKISMALKDPILQIGFEIICEENTELEKQTNYAKLYYQEVVFLQNQLKTLKDKYEKVKKNNIKAKKILKNIADNWKGSGLNAEKYRKILKSYNDAEMFFKEIKEK